MQCDSAVSDKHIWYRLPDTGLVFDRQKDNPIDAFHCVTANHNEQIFVKMEVKRPYALFVLHCSFLCCVISDCAQVGEGCSSWVINSYRRLLESSWAA